MTLQGNAAIYGSGCDCYRMTKDTVDQVSAIWSVSTIDLTQPQDLNFKTYHGTKDTWGADGMVFVLQPNPTAIGTGGNGLGYAGINNSIGVEMDIWNSSPTVPTDIAADHLGIHGDGVHDHALSGGPVALPNIEDGAWHTLRILWDPTLMTLGVIYDGTPYTSYTGDIVTDHFGGNPNVHFGFSASTGGVSNEQRVCMYRTADFTADAVTVCPDVPVNFNDNSSSDLGDNNMTNWDWDFGDSGTDTAENPSYSWTTDGIYTVTLTMTDASGCTAQQTMDIEVLPPLNIDSSFTETLCYGDSSGMAVAIPMSGTAPYTYLWDDAMAQTNDTASALSAGTYSCLVTDDMGCKGSTSVTINEAAEIVITGVTSPDAGGGSGSVDITVTGGVPGAGGYTYSWSSGPTTEDISGLSMGTYTVTVTDSLGCTATADFVINSTQGIGDNGDLGVTLYPNPTNGMFKVIANGKFSAIITDMGGKHIATEIGNGQVSFDLSNYESGLYLVTIRLENAEVIKKLVLN